MQNTVSQLFTSAVLTCQTGFAKKSYSMLTTYTLNRREIKTRQCIRRVITARKYNNNYKRMACGAMEASDYMKNLERGSESMTRFGETS